MWEDTIVEEVRQARERHAEQFNFDLWAIYEDLKLQEMIGQRVIVTLPAKKQRRAIKVNKARQRLQIQKSQPVHE